MEQGENAALSSAFPPPPPYYRHFTKENLDLLASGDEPDSAEKKRALQYLVPPPAPVEGAYSTFGDVWPLPERLPTLSEAGVTQLYSPEPNQDRTEELRNLLKSALLNYLELVGILGVDPAGWGEKIGDLRVIFINMHHLLNEYRPHQARETLCMMMEQAIERINEEIKGIDEACDKVEKVLETVLRGETLHGRQPSYVLHESDLPQDGKMMEDIIQGEQKLSALQPTVERKWYEDEKLLELWNEK